MMAKSIAIVAGAGPGTGAAIARRFARQYPVVVLARSQQSLDPLVREITQSGGAALGVPADLSSAKGMATAMERIKAEWGAELDVRAAIYNVAPSFSRTPFLEHSSADFFGSLEPSIHGAFHFAQATLPLMLNHDAGPHPPTLTFTGATAALKGGSGLSAFAVGKFGVRALAQSLAREFGPKGVHVTHVIVDGIIATDKTQGYGSTAPEGKIDPAAIADSFWYLHTQPRSAFTHELDLRPYVETW